MAELQKQKRPTDTASLELNQPRQHSQLRAMGVVELKTKKPRQMPRLDGL